MVVFEPYARLSRYANFKKFSGNGVDLIVQNLDEKVRIIQPKIKFTNPYKHRLIHILVKKHNLRYFTRCFDV